MNLTLIAALLCCISVSVSELRTVEAQPGEGVTLMCTNLTRRLFHIRWFRLTKGTNVSCISAMLTSESNASFCEGFKNGRFRMTSNITNLFLQIKPVDLSDSGLYFCGEYRDGIPGLSSATYLKVGGNPDERPNLSVILGAVTAFLVTAVAGMAAAIRKLQTADSEEDNPQRSENLDSGDLTDAAQSSAAVRSRRSAWEREVETCVIYTASR